mmetsp:Transcript_67769/g.209661  ORF Transcript_67769/g.209661 Transcript_67769/m.209661 type:complete len:213 (+) Transcript_67769:382-1020(+)
MQPSETVGADGAKVPAHPLARALSDWTAAESSDRPLSLLKGGLVEIWDHTETELGWVYAEALGSGGPGGWVPAKQLRKLTGGAALMKTTRACGAEGEGRLVSAEGEVLLVSMETATEAGWVHAETSDGEGCGWFPVNALGKLPDNCQWLLVSQTYGASYKGQVAVREGSQVLVDPETRTADGWVYALAMDLEDASGSRQGWVPSNCLQWPQP